MQIRNLNWSLSFLLNATLLSDPVKLFLHPLQVLDSKSTTANHFSSFFHAYAWMSLSAHAHKYVCILTYKELYSTHCSVPGLSP